MQSQARNQMNSHKFASHHAVVMPEQRARAIRKSSCNALQQNIQNNNKVDQAVLQSQKVKGYPAKVVMHPTVST